MHIKSNFASPGTLPGLCSGPKTCAPSDIPRPPNDEARAPFVLARDFFIFFLFSFFLFFILRLCRYIFLYRCMFFVSLFVTLFVVVLSLFHCFCCVF